jgi:hypothetical protein
MKLSAMKGWRVLLVKANFKDVGGRVNIRS